MESIDKLAKLHDLMKEIETCLRCYEEFEDMTEEDRIKVRDWYLRGPWFFPPDKSGVKGFFGTGNVMFVCPRPSTGGFDKAVESFYKLLRRYGFSNAHLTDMVKCRSKAGEISRTEVENCLPFLNKEIEILKPRIIIAVGDAVYKELKDKFHNVTKIPHYSYAYRWEKKKKLEMLLKKISKNQKDCY